VTTGGSPVTGTRARLSPVVYAGGAVAGVLVALLTVDAPLAAVAVVFGFTAVLLAWWRPFFLFALLLFALPFHVFAVRVMTGPLNLAPGTIEMFAYWKEGVMVLLAGVLAVRRLLGQDRFHVALFPFDLGLLVVALIMGLYIFVGPRLNIGIYGFRNYLEPLVLFYLLRAMPVTRRELKWLVVGMLLLSVVMAVFGIYQVRVWTFTDLYNWGFREADGTIPTAFYTAEVERQPHLRAVATVTSPNELGLMMMVTIAICLVLLIQPQRPLWQRYSLIGIAALAGVCILYTYSRSALVGLVVMLVALGVLEVGLRNLGHAVGYVLRRPGTILALVVVAVLMVWGAERVGLTARITRAISLNDPSAVGHLASYEASIPFILDHPAGIGMGMAGPRALKFANEVNIEHVESSYLQMMMEIGILPTLFVLAVLLLMVWTLRRQRGRLGDPFFEAINVAAQASWLGALVAFSFLPLMQDLQLLGYLWVVAAIPLVALREGGHSSRTESGPSTSSERSEHASVRASALREVTS
jgi:O-antigen ligase